MRISCATGRRAECALLWSTEGPILTGLGFTIG